MSNDSKCHGLSLICVNARANSSRLTTKPVSSTSALFLGPVSDPKLLIMNFFKVDEPLFCSYIKDSHFEIYKVYVPVLSLRSAGWYQT